MVSLNCVFIVSGDDKLGNCCDLNWRVGCGVKGQMWGLLFK